MTEPGPMPITRIDIVDEKGVREFWADNWEFSLQDEGRTLKLFATGDGKEAETERAVALAKEICTSDQCGYCGRTERECQAWECAGSEAAKQREGLGGIGPW